MMHNPPHPGLILREYLGGISVSQAAARLHLPPATVARLLKGDARISPLAATRIARALQTSPELWTNMQSQYDEWRDCRGNRNL